jgi:putative redox protein
VARNVRVDAAQSRFLQTISIGRHSIQADESVDMGGSDAGASPHELLLAALGVCASITVRMYAERKQWLLDGLHIELAYAETLSSATGSGDLGKAEGIEMNISFWGYLSDEQRAKLLQVANKCPVHQILTSSIPIRAQLAS